MAYLLPCHAVRTKEVTQGPASHEVSLQLELPQCVSVWWSDGRERDEEKLEQCEEMELET